jgi:hypothetical protein
LIAFLAILLMALALVPAGSHFFELPGKIGLGREAYFTVQQVYPAWAPFRIALIVALFVNVILSVVLRGDRTAFMFALGAVAAVLDSLAIFFTWTFPANEATANWTRPVDDWELLRRNWEYSHAVNALVMLLGFCSATLAALTAKR